MDSEADEIAVDFSRAVGRRESYSWGSGRDPIRPATNDGRHLFAAYDTSQSGRMSSSDFRTVLGRFSAQHEAPSIGDKAWELAERFEDSTTGQVLHK